MQTTHRIPKTHLTERRGAAAVFMATLLPVLLIIAAFTVNVSYIQLMRLEHKIAVDASARAAATTLAETDNKNKAWRAARDIAKTHKVGTKKFKLDKTHVKFGNASEQGDGSYQFTANDTPFNAVEVFSDIGATGTRNTAAVPLFFNLSGNAYYARQETSSASFMVNEVILCLDRSGSMKFDMSGSDYHYTSGNPDVPTWAQSQTVDSTSDSAFWEYYYAKPHPTGSRWAILMNAIDVFFNKAGTAAVPPRVGLVTWSSSSNSAGTTTTDYALPAHGIDWNANRNAISAQLSARANQRDTSGVFGGTEMASGLNAGITAIQSGNARNYANKVIILLTDGQYQGSDPYSKALLARDSGIIVHCVALISGSSYNKLRDMATVTGGDIYMATNASELETAFEEIAKSLDTILIK